MTFRPPNWADPHPARIIITFPGQGSAPQYAAGTGVTASVPQSQTQYVFDAVIQAEHHQRLVRSEHPVQTGASISDHAFIQPAKLVLDIGMSDTMDAFFSPSTWAGSDSKSVAAYQTLLALQFSRIPLQITTRLRMYSNMVIEDISPIETHRTIAGLRAIIEFGQIFMANVTQIPNSARSQDTNQTNSGVANPSPPSGAQQAQNKVNQTPPSTAVGAGTWASDNWNSQQSWYDTFGGNR